MGLTIQLYILEVGGIFPSEYPKFTSAFIYQAAFKIGDKFYYCSDEQCDKLTESNPELVHRLAVEKYIP